MVAKSKESKELQQLRIENQRLHAENKRLNQLVKNGGQNKQKRHIRNSLRSLGATLLVILAALLLVLGNIFFWVGNTAIKQDRFVAATEPIIKDPVVQQTVALYATNNIFQNIDVEKSIQDALPPNADFLVPQFADQLKGVTKSSLERVLARPAFQERWNTAVANQHERMINFITNYEGSGTISLNDVYNQLSSSFKDTRLAFLANKSLPENVGSFTLVNASWLPLAHNVVTNIDTWRLLSILALVVFIAASLWLSRNKRRTIYMFSIISAGLLLATLIALRVIRESVTDKADPQYAEGVRHVMTAVFHSFTVQTLTLLLAVLILGLIAWISGSSSGAIKVKNYASILFSGKLHDRLFGTDANSFVLWMQRNKRLLQWGSVAVLTLITLLVRLTFKVLIIYVILLVLIVLGIEVLAGQANETAGKSQQ